MFRRRRDGDQPAPPLSEPASETNFDPDRMRKLLFEALGSRVGEENANMMELDFHKHITHDPVHGVEAAYLCLTGKLVEFIDALSDHVDTIDPLPVPAPASQFSVYRKDL